MKILIAGESWSSTSTHVKGYDQFVSSMYHTGATQLINALELVASVTYIPNHEAAEKFPLTMEDLNHFQVVVLSDIGANTLLLHPATWERGERRPNRLRLLRDYVLAGGGLVMVGGYLSFQGFEAKAAYSGTPLEEVLPVTIFPYDDRLEAPEGLEVEVNLPGHPILRDIPNNWPYLLGLNRVTVKKGTETVASANFFPLLVAGQYGMGRSVAWTSDIGPHWCPNVFCAWDGYETLWQNIVAWVSNPGFHN